MSVAATLGEAVTEAAGRLRAAGIDQPRREARLIVALAAGVEPQTVIGWPERPLEKEAAASLPKLLKRRCSGEPLSRLRGTREFWSLSFLLSEETLDPRPDTETLVEGVLAAIPDRRRPLRLLDIGTGSGCILLSLLHELPAAFGIGLDISLGACRTARGNAATLGLADRCGFVVADWTDALGTSREEARFDLVVSNPPYIPDGDIPGLEPEVARFDPHRALAGGLDGLDAYRTLIPRLPDLLAPYGIAAFEVGAGQADAVGALLEHVGMVVSAVRRDLAGVERCVLAQHLEKSA